jgi:serine/threonine protein kinase
MLHEKNLIVPKFDETNWSGRGQHIEFEPWEGVLIHSMLMPKGVIGHSATALVEKVQCKRIMLARKKIQCNWRVKREEMIEEVAHLQRLSHAHVVRGVGTYIIGKELSILLYPATTHNLETFLNEYTDLNDQPPSPATFVSLYPKEAALGKFLKCLINTIAFVHENLIKHMDIKPTNLLVQEKSNGSRIDYKIYLADFGIARSYRAAVDVETDSPTPFSRTYAAPEVVRQDTRGFPADIFSLGCVFLEIAGALKSQTKEIMDTRQRNLNGDLSYQANLPALFTMPLLGGYLFAAPKLNGTLRVQQQAHYSEYRHIIRAMLDEDPAKRPSAAGLKQMFGAEWMFGTHEPCCLMGPEPFEAATTTSQSHSMETVRE